MTDGFREGVKAMFDFMLIRAADNHHGNPKVQAIKDIENEALVEAAEDGLECLSFEDYKGWKELSEALHEVQNLKNENVKLQAKIAEYEEIIDQHDSDEDCHFNRYR